MVNPITNATQYARALARRELIAAPLREANKLPVGALPSGVRIKLQEFLTELDAQIRQYEYDIAMELRLGFWR